MLATQKNRGRYWIYLESGEDITLRPGLIGWVIALRLIAGRSRKRVGRGEAGLNSEQSSSASTSTSTRACLTIQHIENLPRSIQLTDRHTQADRQPFECSHHAHINMYHLAKSLYLYATSKEGELLCACEYICNLRIDLSR
jgi:hypothetical protein